jgi:hypothetical protein
MVQISLNIRAYASVEQLFLDSSAASNGLKLDGVSCVQDASSKLGAMAAIKLAIYRKFYRSPLPCDQFIFPEEVLPRGNTL